MATDKQYRNLYGKIISKDIRQEVSRLRVKDKLLKDKRIRNAKKFYHTKLNTEKTKLQAKLNNAIKQEKRNRRKEKITAFNNSAPLVQNTLILKYCIFIVLIMTILTFNLTGEIGIETQADYNPYELTELRYEREYHESFIEERTGLNKIIGMTKAIEIFGNNTSWVDITNTLSNTTPSITKIGQVVSTIFFYPLNMIINIGTLAINIVNGWIGKQMIKPINFKLLNIIDAEPIDVIYIPNLFNNLFG